MNILVMSLDEYRVHFYYRNDLQEWMMDQALMFVFSFGIFTLFSQGTTFTSSKDMRVPGALHAV